MQSSKHLQSLSRRFSAGASAYAQHAPAQREAAGNLLALIPDAGFRCILEPGCGTGFFTRLLRARWPQALLDAIDAAPGMIALARETWPGDDRVRWQVADGTSPGVGATYDLVASNCALHWALDLPAALRRLAASLSPGGTLAVSLMLRGTLAELHEARRIAAPGNPPRALLPSRELAETAVWQSGLTVTHAQEQSVRTTFADARTLLRSLHDQGVTGGWLSQGQRALTRGEIARLCEAYEAGHPAPEGGVVATYHIGYFIAERL